MIDFSLASLAVERALLEGDLVAYLSKQKLVNSMIYLIIPKSLIDIILCTCLVYGTVQNIPSSSNVDISLLKVSTWFWDFHICCLTESQVIFGWQYECFSKTGYLRNVKRWHRLIKEKGILPKRPYLHVPFLPNPIYNPTDNVFCLHYLVQMVSQSQAPITSLQRIRITASWNIQLTKYT